MIFIRTLLMIGLSAFSFLANAQEKSSCTLTAEIISQNLKLDYWAFDQNLAGGWREIDNQGCHLEAAQLLDIYHLDHYDILQDWQHGILYWHAGQVYAFLNHTDLALPRMKKAINPNEAPDDAFKWNAYANGTIAFLERDWDKLKENYRILSTATDPNMKVNLAILERMIYCFDKTYEETYNPGVCTPPKP